jgi:wyosine [tRNA(Phe)-imidazoG37] synthetase (radical SAM superfamily)
MYYVVPEMQDALVEMSVSALSDLRLHLHVLEGSEDDRKNALAFINLLKELSPKFHKLSTYVRKADEVKALLAEVKEADKTMKPIERRLSVEGFAAPQSGSYKALNHSTMFIVS